MIVHNWYRGRGDCNRAVGFSTGGIWELIDFFASVRRCGPHTVQEIKGRQVFAPMVTAFEQKMQLRPEHKKRHNGMPRKEEKRQRREAVDRCVRKNEKGQKGSGVR
jgi:hypothetical protein